MIGPNQRPTRNVDMLCVNVWWWEFTILESKANMVDVCVTQLWPSLAWRTLGICPTEHQANDIACNKLQKLNETKQPESEDNMGWSIMNHNRKKKKKIGNFLLGPMIFNLKPKYLVVLVIFWVFDPCNQKEMDPHSTLQMISQALCAKWLPNTNKEKRKMDLFGFL